MLIKFRFNGQPASIDEISRKDYRLNRSILPLLAQKRHSYDGDLAMVGLTPEQDAMDLVDIPSQDWGVSDLRLLAMELSAQVHSAVRRSITTSNATRVGILLSGGLDSILLLKTAQALQVAGELDAVLAYHWTWSDVPEVFSEERVASRVSATEGIPLIRMDQSAVGFRDLVKFYGALRSPHAQTFELQMVRTGETAAQEGVDLLMSGVGCELHTAGDDMVEKIESNAESLQRTPSFASRSSGHIHEIAPWLPAPAIDRSFNDRSLSPDESIKQQWLDNWKLTHRMVCESQFVWQQHSKALPQISYPYLDHEMLRWSATVPVKFRRARWGGAVLGKAYQRLAIHDRYGPSASLRPRGAPYQAIEQNYLRKDWDLVQDFISQPFALASLGAVDVNSLRELAEHRAQLLSYSTMLLPMLLVEGWLRKQVSISEEKRS